MHHEKQLALHWTVLKNSYVIKFLLAVFCKDSLSFGTTSTSFPPYCVTMQKKNNFFITHLAQHNLQYSTVILYILPPQRDLKKSGFFRLQ